jgi:hypothetical protein
MKRRHLFLLAIGLIISHFSQAQGWLGSGQNLYTVPNPSFTSTNVGIGTTAPTAQFHTTGSLRFQNLINTDTPTRVLVTDINGNVFYRNSSTLGANAWQLTGNAGTSIATNFLGTTDNNPFAIRTNNTERIRVLSTGNIGVGITTPGSPLHVYDNSTDNQLFVSGIAPSIRMFNGTSWPSNLSMPMARLGVANQNNDFIANSVKGDFCIETVDTVGSLIFAVGLIPGLLNCMERMRVAKNGFVGIDAKNPTARLHVDCAFGPGQSTNSNIRFDSLQSGTGTTLVIDANGYVYRSSTGLAVASSPEMQQLQTDLDEARTELANMKTRLGLIESALANNKLSSLSSTLSDMPRLIGSRPNPGPGQTTIDYYLSSSVSQANCVITTLDGRTIASYELVPQRGNGNVNVILNNQAAGLYLYTLMVNGKVIDTQKMMLSK